MAKEPRKGVKDIREREVERYLVDECKKIGVMCAKFEGTSFSGFPDRLIYGPNGLHDLVELKRPVGGRVSAIQKIVHDKLKGLGQDVKLISSYDEVDKYVKDISTTIELTDMLANLSIKCLHALSTRVFHEVVKYETGETLIIVNIKASYLDPVQVIIANSFTKILQEGEHKYNFVSSLQDINQLVSMLSEMQTDAIARDL